MADRRSLVGKPPDEDRRGAAPFFERITREGGADEKALRMLFGDDPRGRELDPDTDFQPLTEAARQAQKDRAVSVSGEDEVDSPG